MTRWTLTAALTAAVVACSSTTAPSATPNIAGTWALSGSASNSSVSAVCTLKGQLAVQQSGTTVTGQVSGSTASCTGPKPVSGTIDGTLAGGKLSGAAVSFTEQSCTFTGTVTGSPSNKMTGPLSCQVKELANATVTGTWTASR